jgi:hypothetical protein
MIECDKTSGKESFLRKFRKFRKNRIFFMRQNTLNMLKVYGLYIEYSPKFAHFLENFIYVHPNFFKKYKQ